MAEVSMCKGVQVTDVGIVFPDDYKFNNWLKDGEAIGRMSKSILFYLGDWCNYGEQKYGEKYSQALEHTKFDYGTLRNAAWVCSSVPLERRNKNLTFGHHYEVAKLKEHEQVQMLSEAELNTWSVRQLRNVVKALVAPNIPPEDRKRAMELAALPRKTFEVWWEEYRKTSEIVFTEVEEKLARAAWAASRENL